MKKSNKNWSEIFDKYIKSKKAFKPSSFDSKYLEDIMKNTKISSDDIMIADRISQMDNMKNVNLITTKELIQSMETVYDSVYQSVYQSRDSFISNLQYKNENNTVTDSVYNSVYNLEVSYTPDIEPNFYEDYGLKNSILDRYFYDDGSIYEFLDMYDFLNKISDETKFVNQLEEEYPDKNFENLFYKVYEITGEDYSQYKNMNTFEKLIAKRKKGVSWKEIKAMLGIVNTESKLPRIAVSSGEIKKYMKETGLSENEITEALIMSKKMNVNDKEVIEKFKNGKKSVEILQEHLNKKYKN